MLMDFLNQPDLRREELASLAVLSGGGAAMPKAVAERIQSLWGIPYIEGYGMSETMAPTHINPPQAPKAQCLGLPICNTRALIVDPVTLLPVPQGDAGEILVNGPQLLSGYWNNPAATEAAFVTVDGVRYLRTGDLAYEDEQGYFFMVDRVKRMINASGYKVWPAEVEAFLYGHPAVQEACVIGYQDTHRGESVKALVVAKAGVDASADDIIAWSREHMAAYKVPHAVEFVDSLPKSATGKDNDIYGHVNNVEYYSYFDTVINTYLILEGGLDIQAGGVIGVCAESHCKFLGELAFPETVDAGLRVEHLGNSSVRYGIGLFRPGRDTPAAEGWFVHDHAVKVRAAVLRQTGLPGPYAHSKPLLIESVELARPAAGELLVRVLAAGLCHSDLSVIDGSRPRPLPMVLGHEATGEVVELGADVSGFSIGDRVVFSFVPMCGHCVPVPQAQHDPCRPVAQVLHADAQANASGRLLGGGLRWHDASSAPLQHHLGVSGFAEYTVTSAHSAVRIDADLPPEIAALFGCAVMTGVGAVINTARVAPGESVAVFGLGGVGLAALLGARAASAYPLIAVDVVPEKLALARELGADFAINSREGDAVAMIRELTGGGVMHAIESVGSETVLGQARLAARARGPRGGATVKLQFGFAGRRSRCSAFRPRDIPRYVALYRNGRLPVDRLLSHRLRLEDINAGFDRLKTGEAIRQVVLFD
ncbi:MAG: hypothetical protein WDW38_007807 [Sanguina aurantia]